MSERPVRLEESEAVGIDAILGRLERLAADRETIQADLDANHREQIELVGRWNRNVADEERHRLKLKQLLGAGVGE